MVAAFRQLLEEGQNLEEAIVEGSLLVLPALYRLACCSAALRGVRSAAPAVRDFPVGDAPA